MKNYIKNCDRLIREKVDASFILSSCKSATKYLAETDIDDLDEITAINCCIKDINACSDDKNYDYVVTACGSVIYTTISDPSGKYQNDYDLHYKYDSKTNKHENCDDNECVKSCDRILGSISFDSYTQITEDSNFLSVCIDQSIEDCMEYFDLDDSDCILDSSYDYENVEITKIRETSDSNVVEVDASVEIWYTEDPEEGELDTFEEELNYIYHLDTKQFELVGNSYR